MSVTTVERVPRRPAIALLILSATAVLVLAVVVGGQRTQPQPPLPDTRPRAVITLGDSLMSGEGAGAYLAGTRGANGHFCHRSGRALVHQVALPDVSVRINLACSGADAADVGFAPPETAPGTAQAAQLHRLAQRYHVVAVLVSLGGNGAPQFADTMLRCVQAWAAPSGPPCSTTLAQQWPQRLQKMIPDVVGALTDIRTALRTAGYADDEYKLVLTSYPAPVTEDIAPALQDLSGCPFRTADLRWIRTVAVPQLSAALRAAARRAGARFLDLSRAAEGHEACSHAQAPWREWITRLTVDFGLLRQQDSGLRAVVESFHPNATGHAKLARCVNEFLRSDARQAACLIGPDAELHARQVQSPAAK